MAQYASFCFTMGPFNHFMFGLHITGFVLLQHDNGVTTVGVVCRGPH